MELTERFYKTRSDKVIALARLVLAAFMVGAVWLDPSQPIHVPVLTYLVLVAYVGFAAVAVFALSRQISPDWRLALPAHLVDMAVFAFLVYSTEGPASPFFLLFTFSMISATFRWHWKGALWTSLAVLVLLLGSAAAYAWIAPEMRLETDRFLLRCAHVTVTGAMLVYFGVHQQRIADEMARLGTWPVDPLSATDLGGFLAACAAHAAQVFDTSRVLIVISDSEEPWATAACREDGAFRTERLSPDRLAALVPPALAEASFMAGARAGEILVAPPGGGLRSRPGAPVLTELREGYGIDQVLSAPIQSERVHGRLFVADPPDLTREDLILAGVAAGQIGAGLDRMETIDALRRSSLAEDRLTLARDLHDGILQTLSATALQLENLARTAEDDPPAVRARVTALQNWLVDEQRELRSLIRRLRPGAVAASVEGHAHGAGLPGLAKSLQQQWGIEIECSVEPAGLVLAPDLQFNLHQIVREAAANAARHGSASGISVRVSETVTDLQVMIADNGRGLVPHGVYDAEACARLRIGPRSLRERIGKLGGSLLIDSKPSGLTLSISLPLREREACA